VTNNYFKVSVHTTDTPRDSWPTDGFIPNRLAGVEHETGGEPKRRSYSWVFAFNGTDPEASKLAYERAFRVWQRLALMSASSDGHHSEPHMSVYAPNAGTIVVNRIGYCAGPAGAAGRVLN